MRLPGQRCCSCAASPRPCLRGNGWSPSSQRRCFKGTKMQVWSLAMVVAFLLLGKMNLFPGGMSEFYSFRMWIGVSLFLPILSCWNFLLLLDLNSTILFPTPLLFYLALSPCAKV